MKYKRLLHLFLACLLSLAFSACGASDNNEFSDNSDSTPYTSVSSISEQTAIPDIEIISNGIANYKLIRPTGVGSTLVTSCMDLYRTFIKVYPDSGIKLKTDFVDLDTKSGYISDELEILIGTTNRVESEEVEAELGPLEYTVRVSGNKLLIMGNNDYTTMLAVEYFIENYCKYPAPIIR